MRGTDGTYVGSWYDPNGNAQQGGLVLTFKGKSVKGELSYFNYRQSVAVVGSIEADGTFMGTVSDGVEMTDTQGLLTLHDSTLAGRFTFKGATYLVTGSKG